jgi:three-Cys-motif partner protein
LTQHKFGGPWTEEKLTRLRKYLEAYTMIFTRNPRARFFRRWYVDAFAGTGVRSSNTKDQESTTQPLFEADADAQDFMKGSARIALDIAPPFDRYLFIEKDPAFASDLDDLRSEYSDLSSRIGVANGDANDVLVRWAGDTNWDTDRAVVFLDPYGMQVEWRTIEALADTKAVDLWVLFPLGQGLNRLLTRGGPPPPAWEARLTRSLGTDSWKDAFYRKVEQLSLFDSDEHLEKSATFESMAAFVNDRLDSVFEMVAPNPLLLRNSRNNPIFLLCFAAANEKGAPTAVKIARNLLEA